MLNFASLPHGDYLLKFVFDAFDVQLGLSGVRIVVLEHPEDPGCMKRKRATSQPQTMLASR